MRSRALLLLAAAGLSAGCGRCGSRPPAPKTGPRAVAVVNGETITAEALKRELDHARAAGAEGGSPDGVLRRRLPRLALRRLAGPGAPLAGGAEDSSQGAAHGREALRRRGLPRRAGDGGRRGAPLRRARRRLRAASTSSRLADRGPHARGGAEAPGGAAPPPQVVRGRGRSRLAVAGGEGRRRPGLVRQGLRDAGGVRRLLQAAAQRGLRGDALAVRVSPVQGDGAPAGPAAPARQVRPVIYDKLLREG